MKSDPFDVQLTAGSEWFFRNCDRGIVTDEFVPASVGGNQGEFNKTLANTLSICGASLHPLTTIKSSLNLCHLH